jgi:uncharacterized protein (UPF0248 family)
LGVKISIIIIGRVDTCCALPPGGYVFDSWQHLILFYKGKSIPILFIIENQFLRQLILFYKGKSIPYHGIHSDKILSQAIKEHFSLKKFNFDMYINTKHAQFLFIFLKNTKLFLIENTDFLFNI